MKKLAAIAFLAGTLTSLSAIAQDNTLPTEEPASSRLWFYLEGANLLDTDSDMSEAAPVLPGSAQAGDGWDVNGKLGFKWTDTVDVALGGRYFEQSKGPGTDIFNWTFLEGRYWNVDGDVGWTAGGDSFRARLFLGGRFQHYEADFTDTVPPVFATTVTSWGVGPHGGFEASLKAIGPVSILAGADAAILFGEISDSKNANFALAANGDNDRTFFDVAGRLGLGWAPTRHLRFSAGYKAEWLDGITYETASNQTDPNLAPSGSGGELIHGPFGRVGLDF